ncbi:hypothetical protein IMG5_013180 [Ichthyophthirius multifiliis]|uniref:Cyclic nucleotide-binding domain-containing protein n=1 Tax=Ichthyophthirius multifiliis TaxID=5932 RepID=G0QK55_ICHMU|nr:hypothetical protein IMG5_013180 [Ichthyophthirius multifiliis]EGR34400.1 hypothetical protein IMG5_013180 [Ichthyophthirius multifiliis]|eukprot:XP_004039704.1 hypothetical protein IMG5_013180 [Ichthyophthirius multifiliis]
MACQYANDLNESNRMFLIDLEHLLQEKNTNLKYNYELEKYKLSDPDYNIIKLPRGGVVIRTKIGNIQYGLPPETNPLKPEEDITVDTLLTFKVFNDDNSCIIKDSNRNIIIEIIKQKNSFKIIENQIEIAEIEDVVNLSQKKLKYNLNTKRSNSLIQSKNDMEDQSPFNLTKQQGTIQQTAQTFENLTINSTNNIDSKNMLNSQYKQSDFKPPDFGVTILGNSHGFDPHGNTSGFIIWIYGRGIMVDPPPYQNQYLKSLGINHQLISGIIISHCHADHDAGTFHQIVAHGKIEVITTKTIMDSFLRKYSAISQISIVELNSLFAFRQVIIGTNMQMFGGCFSFFYSLHTIPSLGFEVKVQNKKIYFSSDTFYNPKVLFQFYQQGNLSKQRYDQFISIDFSKYDLILHEAGVPPIHTPQQILADFPQEIKEKLYLIHIAEKDLLQNSGLKIAQVGVENTIILYQNIQNNEVQLIQRLDIISKIDLFEYLPLKHAKYLMDCVKVEYYQKDEFIFKEGDIGDKFYIIQYGQVRIYSDTFIKLDKYFSIGDYFGEISVLDSNSKRIANAQSVNESTLLILEKHDFNFIFGTENNVVLKKLKQLSKVRKSQAIEIIDKNSILEKLEQFQKTELEMIMKEKKYQKGDIIWNFDQEIQISILLKKGIIKYHKNNEEFQLLVSGCFIGDVKDLLDSKNHQSKLVCQTDCNVYQINKKIQLNFCKLIQELNLFFKINNILIDQNKYKIKQYIYIYINIYIFQFNIIYYYIDFLIFVLIFIKYLFNYIYIQNEQQNYFFIYEFFKKYLFYFTFIIIYNQNKIQQLYYN